MAITLADFNKIWASTSPLTPYSFSEANYKQGWNFIGSTPPARQMWDFLQKNNDEKMQYLANNYLPLSGGTMSGTITCSNSTAIKKDTDDGDLVIEGASAYNKGAYLQLYGKDYSNPTNASSFSLTANDGTRHPTLVGRPDGSLVWGGNNVITSALTGNILTAIGNAATTGGTTHELCSITTHDAGVWLINSYVDLSVSLPATAGSYQNIISTENHETRTCRGYGHNGGGMVNMFITSLNVNEKVALDSLVSTGTSCTIRGNFQMVRLA